MDESEVNEEKDLLVTLPLIDPTNELINLDLVEVAIGSSSTNLLIHSIYSKSLLEKEEFISNVIPLTTTEAETGNPDEQLEAIAISAITEPLQPIALEEQERIKLKTHLNDLKSQLRTLSDRCEQFNDVKQSIRSVNDHIKEEMFLDFGSIAVMLRTKLDELTNQIKERLKDAYSVVRDRHDKINERLKLIKNNVVQIEQALDSAPQSLAEQLLEQLNESREQIEQIYDELKLICAPGSSSSSSSNFVQPTVTPVTVTSTLATNTNVNSICNSTCSLFIDNNLYPQFNYFVDLNKLVNEINALNVQIFNINPNQNSDYSVIVDNNNNNNNNEYIENAIFYCTVTSRLFNDGSCWLKILCSQNDIPSTVESIESANESQLRVINKALEKTNLFIEELNKQVRRKRIGNKHWLTYAEAGRIPLAGEKCFCLEAKTRKWLRSVVVVSSNNGQSNEIRFLDTGGQTETNYSSDQMLIWPTSGADEDESNLDLMILAPVKSIKCYLFDQENKINPICLETKFHFKDITVNKRYFKCRLIKQYTESSDTEWYVELMDKQMSVNDEIIQYNKKEMEKSNNKSAKVFNSCDYRVQTGQITEIVNHMVKTRPDDLTPSSQEQVHEKRQENVQEHVQEQVEEQVEEQMHVPLQQTPEFEENSPKNADSTTIALATSTSIDSSNLECSDIEDQTEANRAYKLTRGKCVCSKHISEEGIFWIRPLISASSELFEHFKEMSKYIGDFIERGKWCSYAVSGKPLVPWKKCFVRLPPFNQQHQQQQHYLWYRGQIEKVFNQNRARVRMLDNGFAKDLDIKDIYPHRRFLDEKIDTKLEYLAIRCCLFPPGYKIKLSQDASNYFIKMLTNHHSDELMFELVEQVELNIGNAKRKYWFAELYNEYIARPNTPINFILLEYILTTRHQSSDSGQNNMKLAQLFSKNKEKYQLKSAKSIEDIQQKIHQQENSNLSLPVIYHEQTTASKYTSKNKTKRNKPKQQKQSQPQSKTFTNSMRRKSKSFENIPEESETNQNYMTIAHGIGVAAAAENLQQTVDLSTKYHHRQPHNDQVNRYISLPYSPQPQLHHAHPHSLVIDSNTITINKDEPQDQQSDNKNKKNKKKRSSCKNYEEIRYYRPPKRDDEDDVEGKRNYSGSNGANGLRRHGAGAGRSGNATGGENNEPADGQRKDCGRKHLANPFECYFDHELIQDTHENHTYIAEFNPNYDENLPSYIFNDVFIGASQNHQQKIEKSMKRSKSCCDEYLMMQTNEDYHVERTRSELTDEYDQHSYKNDNSQNNNNTEYKVSMGQLHQQLSVSNHDDCLPFLLNDQSIEMASKINGCIQLIVDDDHSEIDEYDAIQKLNCKDLTLLHDSTQAIPFRHMYISPLLSADSSQKYITNQQQQQQQQQQQNENPLEIPKPTKQRSHSEETNQKYFSPSTPAATQSKLIVTYSSTSSSNKTVNSSGASSSSHSSSNRHKKNSVNRAGEEDDDFYASCAEEYPAEDVSELFFNIRNSSPTTLLALPPPPHLLIHLHHQQQQQRQQQSEDKEAQTDDLALRKTKLKKFTISVFVDSFDDYSINSNNSMEDHVANDQVNSKKLFFNSSQLVINDKEKNKENGQETCDSLKEFEMNEAKLTCPIDQMIPAKTSDDPFIFNSNPNNYDNLLHFKTIVSNKPPLIPSTNTASASVSMSSTHLSHQTTVNHLINVSCSNQCLSTITECSNETFETCSNQSPKENTHQQQEQSVDEKNVTLRRKKSPSSSADTGDPRRFERFCLSSNNYFIEEEQQQQQQLPQPSSDRICSKLLNEVINQSLSLTDAVFAGSNNKSNNKIMMSLETNGFDEIEDDVEDEVFLKSNHLKSSSSLPLMENNNNNNNNNNQRSPTAIFKQQQNKFNKNIKPSPNLMNVSSATTLEISSLTSDSLFNSNLIITPICSDKNEAVSPFNPNNVNNTANLTNPSLSLFNQQSSQPHQQQQQQNQQHMSTSSPANLTPNKIHKSQAGLSFLSNKTPSPPPLPTIQTLSQLNTSNNNMFSPTFPSPPKLTTIQSPFSNESSTSNAFLPPPPPLPELFQSQTNELFHQTNEKRHLKLPTNNATNNNVNNNNKQPKLANNNSLIEHLTQRLNLSSVNSGKNKDRKLPIVPLPSKQLKQSSIVITTNEQQLPQQQKQSHHQSFQSNNQWKVNNLYGLDTDDCDDFNKTVPDEDFSFPAPPPPPPLPPPLPSFQLHSPFMNNNNNNSSRNDSSETNPFQMTSENAKKFWQNITNNSNASSRTEPPPAPTLRISNTTLSLSQQQRQRDKNNNNIKASSSLIFNQSCPPLLYNQYHQTTIQQHQEQDEDDYSSSSSSYSSNSNTNNNNNNNTVTSNEQFDSTSSSTELSSLVEPNYNQQDQPYKLDHLIDINPKRLFKGCKFKAKIHDIIDENGHFWLEVIYSREEEEKFNEIFRLFRLCSRISEPPKHLYVHKFLSAFYKENWHRALVIELPCVQNQNKVLVRFLDLGITKFVHRFEELREIDEKFFNCPLKSLHCTIYVDNTFKLTKECRKFFTKLIYKKVLYIKLIDFVAVSPSKEYQETICQVIIGCETKRGIIDVYMYLLSKFDRRRYDLMKNRVNLSQDEIDSARVDLITKSTSTSYLCLPTPTPSNRLQIHKQQQQQHDSSSLDETQLDQDRDDDEDEETEEEDNEDEEDNVDDYVEEKEHESVDLCDTELIDNVYEPDHTDSDINQYENDNTQDDTQDNAMFTDNLNSCCIERSNLDNTIIYRSNDNDDEDDYQDDLGLDLYPVREDDINARKYKNSEVLHFESINLPSPPASTPPPAPPLPPKFQMSQFKTPIISAQSNSIPVDNRYNCSTVVASRTKHLLRQQNFTNTNVYNMTMPFPPSNPLTSSQYNQLKQKANNSDPNNLNNSLSDTDSSITHIGGPCCAGKLKFMKWTPTNGNSLHKFKQKLNSNTSSDSIKKRNEAIENDLFNRLMASSDINSRKVKFQMK